MQVNSYGPAWSAMTIVWRNEDEKGGFYLFNIKTPDCVTDCKDKDSGGTEYLLMRFRDSEASHSTSSSITCIFLSSFPSSTALLTACEEYLVVMESKRCSNTTPGKQGEKWIMVFHCQLWHWKYNNLEAIWLELKMSKSIVPYRNIIDILYVAVILAQNFQGFHKCSLMTNLL